MPYDAETRARTMQKLLLERDAIGDSLVEVWYPAREMAGYERRMEARSS